MSHLDLLKTVHLPVTADGKALKNSFGVAIGSAKDIATAEAMARLLNLSQPAAEAEQRAYEEAEGRKARMFARGLAPDAP